MPRVLPETSFPSVPSSPAGQGRLPAGQSDAAFSLLLDNPDPAPSTAAPDRAEGGTRKESLPARANQPIESSQRAGTKIERSKPAAGEDNKASTLTDVAAAARVDGGEETEETASGEPKKAGIESDTADAGDKIVPAAIQITVAPGAVAWAVPAPTGEILAPPPESPPTLAIVGNAVLVSTRPGAIPPASNPETTPAVPQPGPVPAAAPPAGEAAALQPGEPSLPAAPAENPSPTSVQDRIAPRFGTALPAAESVAAAPAYAPGQTDEMGLAASPAVSELVQAGADRPITASGITVDGKTPAMPSTKTVAMQGAGEEAFEPAAANAAEKIPEAPTAPARSPATASPDARIKSPTLEAPAAVDQGSQRPNDSSPNPSQPAQTTASAGSATPTTHNAPFSANSPVVTASTAAPVPAVAVPLAGLAVEIAVRARSGKNRFEIRLDPPELGRIDVRLDVDREGHVTSRLLVERSETLDLLRRDAPMLERALQQAGLKTSDQGLQFSLRDQAFSGRDGNPHAPAMARIVVADTAAPIELPRNHERLAGLGGGVDIRV